MTSWASEVVWIGDLLLGWSLLLNRDLGLVLLAVTTAGFLLAVRGRMTNQTRLRQIRTDRQRLRESLRETGKSDQDTERLRRVRFAVNALRLREELKPAVLSFVPLALLAGWMSIRFDYLPPAADSEIQVTVEAPLTRADTPIHLIPTSGLTAIAGWVRLLDENRASATSRAAWSLKALATEEQYRLRFRSRETLIESSLMVGGPVYLPPRTEPLEGWAIVVALEPYRPLGGMIPWRCWIVPGWLVVYLACSVTTYLLGQKVLRIE